MNDGSRLSVQIQCSETSTMYDERAVVEPRIQAASGLNSDQVEVVKKKKLKPNEIKIRVQLDDKTLVDMKFPAFEASDVTDWEEIFAGIMQNLKEKLRAGKGPHNKPDAPVQLPMFDEEQLVSDDDSANPISPLIREMDPVHLFGQVVKRLLRKAHKSIADTADALFVDEDYVIDLLSGEIPDSLIEDDLLVDLAGWVDVSVDMFRILLRRPVTPVCAEFTHVENDLPEQWLSESWHDLNLDNPRPDLRD